MIIRGICRSEDCHRAKQRDGNRRGVDAQYDFRFHSAHGDSVVYLFLRRFLCGVAKKFQNIYRRQERPWIGAETTDVVRTAPADKQPVSADLARG